MWREDTWSMSRGSREILGMLGLEFGHETPAKGKFQKLWGEEWKGTTNVCNAKLMGDQQFPLSQPEGYVTTYNNTLYSITLHTCLPHLLFSLTILFIAL